MSIKFSGVMGRRAKKKSHPLTGVAPRSAGRKKVQSGNKRDNRNCDEADPGVKYFLCRGDVRTQDFINESESHKDRG